MPAGGAQGCDAVPDPERFRALARSAPWRWRTVQFTVTWQGPYSGAPVRAWIDRAGAGLRVEDLHGELILAETQAPDSRSSTLLATASFGWFRGRARRATQAQAADALARHKAEAHAQLAFGDDSLVRYRPPYIRFDYDAPMYQNYHWVAMLDPVELTDGSDPETGAQVLGTQVSEVSTVEHHGRQAWQAVVRPVPGYDPRCSCCSLLPGPVAQALDEVAAGGARLEPAAGEFPEAYRVRLDTETGICVLTEPVGAGAWGHRVVIEAVDAEYPAAMFRR